MGIFSGETKNGAPILGAGYWKKGTKLAGVVVNKFQTSNGTCYQLSLMDEITVPGHVLYPKQEGKVTSKEFAIGALKGFEMALRACGCGELQEKDLVKIECIGLSDSGKGSPRVDFKLDVTRR